jgi:hypothetical protein
MVKKLETVDRAKGIPKVTGHSLTFNCIGQSKNDLNLIAVKFYFSGNL